MIGYLRLSPILMLSALLATTPAAQGATDRDILVTFDNLGVRAVAGRPGASYGQRKRYTIARRVRHDATAVARRYELLEVDHWPIRSLAVYCFVFRVAEGADRAAVIDELAKDSRIESVQALQTFETSIVGGTDYNDTYRRLQHGLDALNVAAAHRASTGKGVRIAIVDSSVDTSHEDLEGRVRRSRSFHADGVRPNSEHGTAVASVIGARSNNAKGIVGVAPDASLEVFVSCWDGGRGRAAVCDSFSLSKALDAMLDDPPDILNLSLRGPRDPLLERLLHKAAEAGVLIVGAGAPDVRNPGVFPSGVENVLGVESSPAASENVPRNEPELLFAPGNQILVALPADQYDFRSGSSLAAAHVTGVVALLLAVDRDLGASAIYESLLASQRSSHGELSIDACRALDHATGSLACRSATRP